MFFNVLLLVLSLHLCAGQTILFGACENVETMKYFELERVSIRMLRNLSGVTVKSVKSKYWNLKILISCKLW